MSQSQEGKTKHGERAGWGISASVKLCAQPFQERDPVHCGSSPHPRGRPSHRRLHFASQSTHQAEGARRFLAKETPLLPRASPLRFPRAGAGRASQGFSRGRWKRLGRGEGGFRSVPLSGREEFQPPHLPRRGSLPGCGSPLATPPAPNPGVPWMGHKRRGTIRVLELLSSNLHPSLCSLPSGWRGVAIRCPAAARGSRGLFCAAASGKPA